MLHFTERFPNLISPQNLAFQKVAFARKDLKADVIVDMATLTGAQGITTGQYHGAILTNNASMESSCVEAGKVSGDLVVIRRKLCLGFFLY